MTIRGFFMNSLVSVCLSASLFAAGCSSESATDSDVAGAAEAQEADVRGAKARLGQACNDFMGKPCAKGLSCEVEPLPPGVLGIPERGGVCKKLPAQTQNECATDDDCAPTDRCAPGRCYAFCLPNDKSCCAPATCMPKPAPVPTTTACGDVTCGKGLACCNPLRGICTKPGEFCIF